MGYVPTDQTDHAAEPEISKAADQRADSAASRVSFDHVGLDHGGLDSSEREFGRSSWGVKAAPAVPPLPQPSARSSSQRSSSQRYERSHPWRLVQALATATVGGSVMLGLLMTLGLWQAGDRVFTGIRQMLTPAVTEPEVDVRTLVVQQLREASELTTAIFTMEAVVPARSDRTLGNHVIGTTNLLYIAHGEVRAGVDLSQISVSQVQFEGDRRIRVSLPPPQILDSKLDLAKSTVYDYDRGWLGLGPDNAPELQTLAQQEALARIEAAACAENVLAEANQRAERVVSQLLGTAGFESVTVTTQPPLTTCADLANSDTVIPGRL